MPSHEGAGPRPATIANRLLPVLVPVLFICSLVTRAEAQEGTASETRERSTMAGAVLGLGVGYEVGYPVYWPFDDTPVDDPGEDNILTSRATLSMVFPKLFTEGAGLSVKLNAAYYDMLIVNEEYGSMRTYNGERIEGLVENRVQLTSIAAGLDLNFYGQFGDVARLEFGPYGMVGFMPEFTETNRLTAPYTGRVEWTERHEKENDVVLVETGAALTVSFEIPLGAGLALLPSVTGRCGAATDSEDEEWWVNAHGGIGLSLLFGTTTAD